MKLPVFDMFKVASLYHSFGWKLFPIERGKKIPSYDGSNISWQTEWKDKPSMSDMFTWFNGKTNEDIGIGMVLGKESNIVCIDDDNFKDIPRDLWKPNPNINSKMMVKSGGKGFHYYFKYSEDLNSFTREIITVDEKDLDIRMNNHWIVLPPTIHPQTQNLYKWHNTYEIKDFRKNIDILPSFVLVKLFEKKDANMKSTTGHPLQKSLSGVGIGNREPTLAKVAMSLRSIHTTDENAILILRGLNASFQPPHEDSVVVKAWEKTLRQWENKNKNKWEAEEVRQIPKPRSAIEISTERLEAKKREREAIKTGYGTLDHIIGGLLEGHLYTMTGDTNAGKTVFACNIAHNLIKQNKRVLYLALESDVAISDVFIALDKKKEFWQLDESDYPYDFKVEHLLQRDCQSFEQLKEILEVNAENYNLIIVDHIGYFVQSENNFIQQQSNLLKQLAGLTKTKKTAILIIAHPRKRKDDEKRIRKNEIAGSSSFYQDSTDVWILYRPQITINGITRNDNLLELDVEKKKSKPEIKEKRVVFSYNESNPRIREIDKHAREEVYISAEEINKILNN